MQTAADTELLTVKRPVGPPSKWNKQLIAKARQYLDNYEDYGKNIPTVARLSQVLGISKDRIYVWAKQKDKKELKDILSQLKVIQEAVLLENGLSSEFNPTITKLLLTKHGYHDNPQANQGSTGITVNVNRGGVVIKSGGETLAIETAQPKGVTIDHE